MSNKKIAVLYICTGKYELFWSRFFQECESFFYPGLEKHYYVFTDSVNIIQTKNKQVTAYYQIKTGWPYDTLLRFQWFMSIQDRLRDYDICFYFNANSTFRHIVTEEVIPFPTEDKPILLWCHPNSFDDELGDSANPERNSHLFLKALAAVAMVAVSLVALRRHLSVCAESCVIIFSKICPMV